MSIDWFRDLVICIFGLTAVGVLIFTAVLAFSLYRRVKPTLDSLKTTSRTVESLTSCAADEVAKPLIQLAAFVQGIRQARDMVGGLFKKQKGGKDD